MKKKTNKNLKTEKNPLKKPAKKTSYQEREQGYLNVRSTIYIGNLNYNITERDIFGIFGQFGKVQEVKMIKIPNTDKHRGIAFVDMCDNRDVPKAINGLDGKVIDGRTAKVSKAIDNKKEAKKQRMGILPPKKKASTPRTKPIKR